MYEIDKKKLFFKTFFWFVNLKLLQLFKKKLEWLDERLEIYKPSPRIFTSEIAFVCRI